MGVISIDGAAVADTAEAVDALAAAVEAAGQTLASSLLAAEVSLAGSSSASACTELTDAAHDVHGDLATALDGLAQGAAVRGRQLHARGRGRRRAGDRDVVGHVTWTDVPTWMTRGADTVADAEQALRDAGRSLAEAEATLTGLLVDAAGQLGWRGDAAEAAEVRSARTGTQLDAVVGAFDSAAAALRALASALTSAGPRLASLQDRDRLSRIPVGSSSLPSPTGDPLAEERAQVKADLRAAVDELAADDLAARCRLRRVAAELERLGALASADGWVGTAAPQGVLAVLAAHGVVTGAADAELLGWAAGLPDGPGGDAALRGRLASLPSAEAADLLLRHPELAQRLQGPLPVPPDHGSPEARLAAAMSTPAAERISAVAEAFADMDGDERSRLALLYPAVVGRLDGAPLAARMAANRVQITAALQHERDLVTSRARDEAGRGTVDAWLEEHSDDAFLPVIAEFDGEGSARERGLARIAYYQELLYAELPNPAPGPGRPTSVGHQVLYFDPAGDGTLAEMWGPLDAGTRNVALFVPGTSADLEGFASYSDKMRILAQEDWTGGTTTIAWLGSDMPDAVVADAPHADYALAAGPRLRDFVAGFDVPGRVDVTAIGHSYGGAVVGVADDSGLDVDRVLHIESAGAGHGVTSVDDYSAGRQVDRYTMQAPGDPIAATQGRDELERFGIGHGADVNDLDGFVRLETGRYGTDIPGQNLDLDGELIHGMSAHSDVLTPGSTSWKNLVGVVQGTSVVPRAPEVTVPVDRGWNPTTWDGEKSVSPYTARDYAGPTPVEVP